MGFKIGKQNERQYFEDLKAAGIEDEKGIHRHWQFTGFLLEKLFNKALAVKDLKGKTVYLNKDSLMQYFDRLAQNPGFSLTQLKGKKTEEFIQSCINVLLGVKKVKNVVEKNGSKLKDYDDSYKKNKAIVLAAVKNDGLALEFADKSLQNDKEVIQAATQQNPKASQFAGPEYSPYNLQNMPLDVLSKIGEFLPSQLGGLSEVAVRKKNKPTFIRGIADAVNKTGVLDAKKFASLETLNNFLQAQGNRVTKLDLSVFGEKIDDEKLIKILSYCPNLKSLNCIDIRGIRGIQKLVNTCTYLEKLKVVSIGSEEALVILSRLKCLQVLKIGFFEGFTDNSLKSLSNLISLTSLQLNRCDAITNDGLDFLAKLINLKELVLSGHHYISQATGRLTASNQFAPGFMSRLSKLDLETLDLRFFKSISDEDLGVISKFPNLKSLLLFSIDNRGFTPDGFKALSQCTNLESLHLQKCGSGITDIDLNHLSGLTKLKVLNLAENDEITGNSGLSSLTSLEVLNLSYCRGLNNLSFLAHMTELRKLNLVYGNLRGHTLAHLSSANKLHTLNLERSGLDDNALASLPILPNLKILNINETYSITDQGISRLSPQPNLRTLQMRFFQGSGTGLSSLSTFSHLRKLNLSWSEITDEGLSHLPTLESLQILKLFNCKNIKGNGFPSLSKQRRLQKLQLSESDVSNEGLIDISSCSSLQHLELFSSHRGKNWQQQTLESLLSNLKTLRTFKFTGPEGDTNLHVIVNAAIKKAKKITNTKTSGNALIYTFAIET